MRPPRPAASRTTVVCAATLALALWSPAGAEPAAAPPPADDSAAPTDSSAPADAAPTDQPATADEGGDGKQAKKDKKPKKDQPGNDDGDHDDWTDADGRARAGDDHDPAAPPADEDRPDIELGGRVFFRATASDDDLNPWIGALTVPSARVGVRYRWKKKLTAKVSFEARGSVRDAYVEVTLAKHLHLRAGRFRLPVSAIERTSTWTLPTIDRGIMSDVLGGGIGVVGRRSAAQLTWDGPGSLHPVVELAVAQSIDTTGVEQPRQLDKGGGLTAVARGEVRPVRGVHVGAFGQTREVNYRTGIGRYLAGGVDLEVDLEAQGLRLWADVIVGTSHLGVVIDQDADTPFVAAQAIVAWRHGGRKRGKSFVEPFVSGAMVNPDAQFRGDLVTQAVAGVGGGRWKRWRGQVQVAVQNAQQKRPASLGGVDVDLDDRVTVSAQLGAAF